MRHQTRLKTLLATTILAATLVPPLAAAEGRLEGWNPWLELNAGGDDQNGGLAGGRLWLPIWQNDSSVAFLDLQAQSRFDDRYNVNAGVGYRILTGEGWILGANAFFDQFETENGNGFRRGSVGLEAFGEVWEARANFYLAEGGRERVSGLSQFDASTASILPGEEAAYSGFDAQVGYRTQLFDSPVAQLRVLAGGYYFDADGFDTIAGPKGGVELVLWEPAGLPRGSQISVEGSAQWDDPRGFNGGGLVSFRMPLQTLFGQPSGHGSFSGLARRMEDRVDREEAGIAWTRLGDPIAATFNGATVTDVIFLNEGGIGLADGSSPENAADFDTYYAGTPVAGALHVVLGDQGKINSVGAQLLDGQVLLGGGGSIVLSGGGVVVDYHAPGARPTLGNEGGGPAAIVTLADNVTIKSIDFMIDQTFLGDLNSGNYRGISGSDIANVWLEDLGIMGSGAGPITNDDQFGREGIFIQRSRNITLTDIVARDIWGEAIDLRAIEGARLTGIDIDGTGRAGLLYSDDDGVLIDAVANEDILVEDFTIRNTGAFGLGVYFGQNVTLRNGAVFDAGQNDDKLGHGLFIVASDSVLAESILIQDMFESGVLVGNFGAVGSTNIVIRDILIDRAETGALFINSSGSITDVTMRGLTALGAGVHLVDTFSTTTVAIDNLTIEDGPLGFRFEGTGQVALSGTGNSSAAVALCEELPANPVIVGGLTVNAIADAVNEANCN